MWPEQLFIEVSDESEEKRREQSHKLKLCIDFYWEKYEKKLGVKKKRFFLFHFSFTFSHLSMHLTDKRGASAVQEGQFIKG